MCLELLREDWGPLRPQVNPWHPSLLFNSDALKHINIGMPWKPEKYHFQIDCKACY